MKKIVVSLVSRQTMQNIIPALFIRPTKVILLTTEQESTTARNIKVVLEKNKIPVEIFPDLIDAYNINTTIEASEKIISQNKDAELILNFTGGTKLMSIPAYEVFRKNNCRLIYCDSEHQRILWFEGKIREEEYKVKIDIEDYLNSYGYHKKENHVIRDIEHKEFVEFIRDNFTIFKEFSSNIPRDESKFRKEKNFVFKDFNLTFSLSSIELDYKNKVILRIKPNEFNYLIGGWFEDYILYVLKSIHSDNFEIEIYKDYKIVSLNGTDNQIDVIMSYNAKLYLFECKSLKNPAKKIDLKEYFKTAGVTNLAGGLFAKGYIVIFESNNEVIKRANQLRLNVITVDDFVKGKFTL